MNKEDLSLLLDLISQTTGSDVVAHACHYYLSDYNSKLSSDEEQDSAPSALVTKRDTVRASYLDMVDKFCTGLQPYVGDHQYKIRSAMMHVFDNDQTGEWFRPRNSKEQFNIRKFCRVIGHLYLNGFFPASTGDEQRFSLRLIARIIGDSALNEHSTKSYSSIITYASRLSTRTGFELFCSNLKPAHFN